jgi:transposase
VLDRIQADENLPGLARELFAIHAKEYAQLQAQIEAKLMTWHKTDPCSRRIAQIRGAGPHLATNEPGHVLGRVDSFYPEPCGCY